MWWTIYLLSFPLVWFENRWIVCSWPSNRPLWFSPTIQSIFWIARIAITYGSIAGIWYANGFIAAAIVFTAYYLFNKVTFKTYYDREIRESTLRYISLLREETQLKNESIDEVKIQQEATQLAKTSALRNMRGWGP